jgi:hypothetical protein
VFRSGQIRGDMEGRRVGLLTVGRVREIEGSREKESGAVASRLPSVNTLHILYVYLLVNIMSESQSACARRARTFLVNIIRFSFTTPFLFLSMSFSLDRWW